jgi:hypothetical protein
MNRGRSATITSLETRRNLSLPAIAEQRILALQKITAPMRKVSEDISGKNKKGGGRRAELARRLWPRLVELWIFAAIAIFFFIRVLGSQAAQHLFSGIGRQHLP